MSGVTDNPFFGQWGLFGVLLSAGSIGWLSILWNVSEKKDELVRNAIVTIRTALSDLFQETVREEALSLYRHVEAHLPVVLSQADEKKPLPSAFDRLCIELKRLEDNKDIEHGTVRDALKSVLCVVLADKISATARQVLADAYSHGASFEFETQQKLAFLAKVSGEATSDERMLRRSKKLIHMTIVAGFLWPVAGLLCTLFHLPACYYGAITAVTLWAATFLVFVVAIVAHVRCHDRLLNLGAKDAILNRWNAAKAKI